MAKLFTGSIDVTKINKETLYKGEKGTYLNVVVWLNDEKDQFGNIMSFQQKTLQGEEKIYLGNAKEFIRDQNITPSSTAKDINESIKTPGGDDLPF